MGSQPRRGELHWAPSSTSRLLIGFTVAPPLEELAEKLIK